MKTKGFKVGNTLSLTLYLSFGLLLISGLLWLIAHYLYSESNDFGIVPSPIEPFSLQVHGAMVPVFMLALGALFPTHISRAFRSKINLKTGIVMLVSIFLLIATGYLLYYSGSDILRNWSRLLHSGIGLLICPMLLIHISRGRHLMRKQKR